MSFTTKLMNVYFSHYVFFTFINISKTLIICSVKQKPSTQSNKFIVFSVRNTDNERSIWLLLLQGSVWPGVRHWLLIGCKAKSLLPALSHKRTDNLFFFKTVMTMNYSKLPVSQVCRFVQIGTDMKTQWAGGETIKKVHRYLGTVWQWKGT